MAWRNEVRKDVLATLMDWWAEKGGGACYAVYRHELTTLAREIAECIPSPDFVVKTTGGSDPTRHKGTEP